MAYQTGQSICPKCRSGQQVRTVRELFDLLNSEYEQRMMRVNQFRRPGFGPGQAAAGQTPADDDDYDHYNVEGSDARRGIGGPGPMGRRSGGGPDFDFDYESSGDIAGDIAGIAVTAALGFAAKGFGKRMKRAFDEKVGPQMQARAEQAQQQWEQSKADQDAIVARYPELRGCLRDNVVFLDGGRRSVPIREIRMPITMDKADALVARLR